MHEQKNEINDVQPSSLRHIVGQRGVVDSVSVAIDAAQMDGRRFDHALSYWPLGKVHYGGGDTPRHHHCVIE